MADYMTAKAITSMDGAYSVKGLNVLITGGNRGIGRGISEAFAQSGANVCIVCTNEESGKKAVEEINKYGGHNMFIKCDVSKLEDCKAAKEAYFAEYDFLDVLINNAGVGCTAPFLTDEGYEEWQKVIAVDLNGVANMCFEFAPAMRDAKRGGTIINTSSIGSERITVSPEQHTAPYSVAKAGVNVFSRYLAMVLGDADIRVLSVMPGPIHSDLEGDLPKEAIENAYRVMPAHRFGEPIEIGAFYVFLASPAATFIRGVNIPFDGGLMCRV